MNATARRRSWLIRIAVAAGALYTLAHILYSGVLHPLRTPNVGQVIEELQPLYRLFTTGSASVDHPRQYGPVFLFLFHPVYQRTLARPDILAWYGYALDLTAIAVAFFATRRAIVFWATSQGITLSGWLSPLLVLLWANFSPLYGVLAIKNVELWELALIAVAGAAFLEQRRWLTAWSIAAAALIKMLPFVFLPYLLLRDRRTFAYAVVAIAVLLTTAQLLYGTPMGWGYLPMIVRAAVSSEGFGNSGGLIWHENVSIRGLAFKAFGYLETPGSVASAPYQLGYYVVVPAELRPFATVVAWVALLAMVIWMLNRLFRNRSKQKMDRLYWEWSLVATLMLVLAPQISQDYMVLALGAFSYVLAGCLVRNRPALWIQFAVAALLVGNLLPRGVFARLLFMDYGIRVADAEHLMLAEAYQYFGFPLLGLLVLLHVWTQVSSSPSDRTHATGERFGYGWTVGGLPPPVTAPVAYHLDMMQTALGAPPLHGLVLDAGAGEGLDLASVGITPGCRAVGIELSAGGIRATAARISALPRASLVQGNILAMPFRSNAFDHAYSYGVVHHTVNPAGAVREIVRTIKPGGQILIYVYEDFERRGRLWQLALASVNAVRRPISEMSPAGIRRVCTVLAPVVFVTCTLPSRYFSWAARFPYPATQNRTMRSLIPDLYDRFAAPIEERYSEAGARALLEQAGCIVKAVAYLRGWAVWGEKLAANPVSEA